MAFSLTGCGGKSELERGFSPSAEDNLATRYFRVYFAYRFPKAKFDLDDVTVEIFYGHRLPEGLKNEETDTKIQIGFHSSNMEIKQVDNFFNDDYAVAFEKDNRGATKRIIYNYSETIQIPKEAFITAGEPLNGKCGSFYMGITCEVTDKNADFFVTNGINGHTYGRQRDRPPIYFRIDGDKVAVSNSQGIWHK